MPGKKDCKQSVMEHAKSGAIIGAGLGSAYGVIITGVKKSGVGSILNNMLHYGIGQAAIGGAVLAVFATTKYCITKKDVPSGVVDPHLDHNVDDMFGFIKKAGGTFTEIK